ncbi:hypothetical protein BT96DRAFT_378624 [Gymnopus androsaceus JB14]|uniref:Uncharacterized protein n=1 Tax=Gymnopus androsaceus JB14 TaxID=1447944 RepID=A0A6A4IE16_9AGAR|nr:hypothetical protein BT96DRAFT_378624 [Gymnopus androsaceus JB14]
MFVVQMKSEISALTSEPSFYYVRQNRLWRYVNDSCTHAVNIVNGSEHAPGTEQFPLQLILDEKPSGIDKGTWKWHGTKLIYQFGSANNSGIYYDCRLSDGGHSLVTFLQRPTTPPLFCALVTLHGFEHDRF